MSRADPHPAPAPHRSLRRPPAAVSKGRSGGVGDVRDLGVEVSEQTPLGIALEALLEHDVGDRPEAGADEQAAVVAPDALGTALPTWRVS